MKKVLFMSLAAFVLMSTGCTNRKEMELSKIIKEVEAQMIPLRTESGLAYWNGTITGDPAEFQKYSDASVKMTEIFSNKETFNNLKVIKESGKIEDPLLKRQLDVLYDSFLSNQADTTLLNLIIEKEAALEMKYSEFRAVYKGKEVDDNKVEEVLRKSTNNKDLEAVWKAHKAIGNAVADDVLEIVRLRNKVANELGFDNYHTMSLKLSGQDPEEISALFDELDEMTRGGFAALKSEMDEQFAKRYNLPKEKLMPWHYQNRFFQEAPNLYPVDLDKYYVGQNQESLTTNFYKSLGMDVEKIMANSDLYPKPKKNQHAYCTDIDGEGDVRVLCNIAENEQWMSTMLHEFGHAVYAQGHDFPENPYILRDAAHTFTTEAVAMLFERLSRNPEWMQLNLGISEIEKNKIKDDCFKSYRLQQLVFSRWTQVVYRFEKEMYANPEQDLNKLWWDIVEKYQMMKRPEGRNEPDWASKIHIALYPCYYHNYQLGALLAAQFQHYIVTNITGSNDMRYDCYTVNPEKIGAWLQESVFKPGMRYEWNDMIERATGEKLTAKYYKMLFLD